ncbi:hypothetical protein [Chryseobacterium sp. GVT01B]|uniref:hypothetical protein n=1 Tax=Chryseobacterium sp. GVT01B TaxID=2862675 RepID=UPI001CBC278E|nr:hypothetical protein [Chryseobacterium sp. GVT01B]
MNNFATVNINRVMIKHTIATPDQDPEIETKNKTFDHTDCYPVCPIEQINFYRFDYSYPFMPMIDLTLIFDELGKMIADWLFTKRENRNTYKKNDHEIL